MPDGYAKEALEMSASLIVKLSGVEENNRFVSGVKTLSAAAKFLEPQLALFWQFY